MSDEHRSGDEILELTDAMAEPMPAVSLQDVPIPPPPPLPPRPSSPPAPPPEAMRPSIPSPSPQTPPRDVKPASGDESSGVTTTPIHRISSPPIAPSTTIPIDPPPKPAQIEPQAVQARLEPSGVKGGLEDAVMDLGIDMVVDEPPPPPRPSGPPPAAAASPPPIAPPPPPAAVTAPPPPPTAIAPSPPASDSKQKSEPEDVEVTVEIDAPAPTSPPIRSRTTRSEDDEEELDLAEAEEMTAKRRTAPPPLPTPGAPARPARMRRKRSDKEWWADIFDDDFLALLPETNPREERREVDFIERALSLPAGSLILDLGCGNGRYTVGMARRGYRMVGVDLSLPMLARAGEAAQEADQKINFIHGDMRDLGFDKTFDGVFCVGTSFGYFDDTTNTKVIEGVSRALKPGGAFLLEVANRDFALERQPSLTWFEGTGSVCMEETEFNYQTSRLQVTRQVIFNTDGRQSRYELSMRLYSLHEIVALLQKAGFSISRVDGHISTPGAFFGIDSAHIAVIAKKNS